MSRLELFKSLILSKNQLLNPALFYETGIPYLEGSAERAIDRIDVSFVNKEERIFIIFYDEKNYTYWYIKSQDAYWDEELTKPEKGEILIEDSIGLAKKALYIDSSTIFVIDADLVESLVDKNLDEDNENYLLNKEQQELILNQMNGFFNQEVPYLSIVQVFKIGDRLKGISLYLCQEKYEYWDEILDNNAWETQEFLILGDAELPTDKNSNQNFTKFVFRTKFQKKYFPNEWKNIFEEEVTYWYDFHFDQKDFIVHDGETY